MMITYTINGNKAHKTRFKNSPQPEHPDTSARGDDGALPHGEA